MLWLSDLVTNAAITRQDGLAAQALREFFEISKGEREKISDECRRVACLPAVTLGVLRAADPNPGAEGVPGPEGTWSSKYGASS